MSAKLETVRKVYREKGWVVVEGIFTPEETDRIAELALKYADLEGPAGAMVEHNDDGDALAPRKVGAPYLKDEAFRTFALDGRLTRVIDALLGRQALLVTDQIFLKPPRHGSAKPYHQDNAYFRCKPDEDVITAWIALDDVDEENGCLRYIDGSHREEIIPHAPIEGQEYNLTPDESQIDLSRESLAPIRKGGVVFHNGNTLHTSHRNNSDRWRRGFATHWVTARTTCEVSTLDHAYYKSDDYPVAIGAPA